MDLIADLGAYLHAHVPPSRSIGLRFVALDEHGLLATAPLAGNGNDKGTAFAGSLAAVMTLSGWAMTNIVARQRAFSPDVAVTRTEIDYLQPVRDDISCVCAWPDEAERERFWRGLAKAGKARLTLNARIGAPDALTATLRASYVARVPGPAGFRGS